MPAPLPTLRGDDDVETIGPALFSGTGVLALLVGAYWMLLKGHIVTRREHEAVKEDRDFWRAAALKGVNAAEKMAEQKSVGIAAVESIARSAERANGGGS